MIFSQAVKNGHYPKLRTGSQYIIEAENEQPPQLAKETIASLRFFSSNTPKQSANQNTFNCSSQSCTHDHFKGMSFCGSLGQAVSD